MVTKCHEKVANARADFQHKRSRTLIDENQAVIVETLKSANMMKNRKLAKHQAKEQGKHLVKLDPWYASSKTCHGCAHKLEAMPLCTQMGLSILRSNGYRSRLKCRPQYS